MDPLIRDHAARCAVQAGREPHDSELAAIAARATATCMAWEISYLHWRTSRSVQRGRSHGVRALLEELRGKHIALWQLMVQNTDLEQGSWLKGTPAFSTLFPNGRRPFQQGGIDSRIEAVGALADKLEQIPAMEPVAMLVRKYFRRLGDARKSQQQERGTKKERSAALEDQRRSAALALYKNMARLMEKYAETPDRILTFFDLRNVRQPFRRKSATGLDS